ncbi:MAG: malonyl-[acyl-carrier protein] O-methyltransferase [Pseudomonadota bacterium]|jgi:malonyl-CoA O-methyltransferase
MSQVRQSFNRAASSYESVSTLQHQVARALTGLISQNLPATRRGIMLDAGSGTGYCLADLQGRYNDAHFIAVDFAERMLQTIPNHTGTFRITADLQTLPFAADTINTYLSSLAWQWCDPTRASQEASRVLEPNGAFFLATLTQGTFRELAQCLQACGLNPNDHLLHCLPVDTIKAAIETADLEIIDLSATSITTWHADFKALRHSIRGVGANHLPAQTAPALNRQTRAQLIKAYEAFRTPQGLPLSYEVLMIHARKG